MAGMRHTSKHKHTKQTGFTVIEVVVVMLIIAVIAGAVVTAFGPDFTESQQNTAAEFEMNQIGRAISSFQQDNPTFVLSDRCTPAGATFLLLEDRPTNPAATPCTIDTTHVAQGTDWDPEYRLGWRGPYLTKIGNEVADIDITIGFDGVIGGAPGTQTNVNVITDPYGNPYFFFDLDAANPRIVSFGPDMNFDGNNGTDICDPNGDDHVLCLF